VADAVSAQVAARTGVSHPHDLVYCSRSGPPSMPWLEPDVNDHLAALASQGVEAVVLAPIGFLSDHMEVAYDLDTEALATAKELGLAAARAATAGTHPDFVGTVLDLLIERAAVERGESVVRASIGAPGPAADVCPAGCCPNLRENLPALCGVDSPAHP
jgi:ferrochelatase